MKVEQSLYDCAKKPGVKEIKVSIERLPVRSTSSLEKADPTFPCFVSRKRKEQLCRMQKDDAMLN